MTKHNYTALLAIAVSLYHEFDIDVTEMTPQEEVDMVVDKLNAECPEMLKDNFDAKEALISSYNYFLNILKEQEQDQ